MSIEFVRIDEKLMHAQILWGWIPLIKPTKIIVANDSAAENSLRKKILISATEPILGETRFDILSLDSVLCENCLKNSNEKIMLILGKPADAVLLAENKINIKKISIGYMSNCLGRKRILENVFLDQNDIKAIRKLIEMGIVIEYQSSPNDTPIDAKVWLPNGLD